MKRLFKKETGLSPIEYLTDKRVAYSKQLLEGRSETALTIKEIAGMVGNNDPPQTHAGYLFNVIASKALQSRFSLVS